MLTAEQVMIALAAPPVFSRQHLLELELAGINLATEHDRLAYKNASLPRGRKCPDLLKQMEHCQTLCKRVVARCAHIRTALDTPDALAAELARQVQVKTRNPFQFR